MNLTKILLTNFSLLALSPAFAQKQNEAFQYHIHKTATPIKIDGTLDEVGWQNAEVASDFFMVLPMDTSKAAVQTDVRLTYDDDYLYIAFVNCNKLPGPNIVESLRRDFTFGKNDNDLLFLDTFDDMVNGFSFGANAAGAEWDGVMSEGSKINLMAPIYRVNLKRINTYLRRKL